MGWGPIIRTTGCQIFVLLRLRYNDRTWWELVARVTKHYGDLDGTSDLQLLTKCYRHLIVTGHYHYDAEIDSAMRADAATTRAVEVRSVHAKRQ